MKFRLSLFFFLLKNRQNMNSYIRMKDLCLTTLTSYERVQYWLGKSENQREILSKLLYDRIAIPENSIGHQVAHILQHSGSSS